MFNSNVFLSNKSLSINDPVYFIAEIGSNFDGDLSKAKNLIRLAKQSGADAAKFQHYKAGSLVSDLGFSLLGQKLGHQSQWDDSVSEVYKNAALNAEWTAELKRECDLVGIDFLTSPYSLDLIDYVDPYVPAYKIGSGDITWIEAIESVASKGKPILLATGASTMVDVSRAVEVISKFTKQLVLMQCNTNYTASKDNYNFLNLNVLLTYKEKFPGVVLGLSDHMPGHCETIAAVALGARVIEKHFTDNITNEGPDHKFALDPSMFKDMVDDVRKVEAALGDGVKRIEDNEVDTAIVQRRSLHATKDINPGELLDLENTKMLRPAPQGSVLPYEFNAEKNPIATQIIPSGSTIFHKDFLYEGE